jgi:hypothetical protein
MRMVFSLWRLSAAVVLATGLQAPGLSSAAFAQEAEENAPAADAGAPSQEYLEAKAQLEEMLAKRDLEVFEVNFEPLTLDRIVIKDRLGQSHDFQYLAFRVRNQVGSTGTPVSQSKGYNDVLTAMAAQYEQAKVTKEGGVGLAVEAGDAKDGMIVERKDARTTSRALDLSVLAFDEHGTRIRLLNDASAGGAQESFNFPDLGHPVQSTPNAQVRDRVEEALHRKLLTVDEIRARKLLPYDAAKLTEEGWAEGELYGVFIFNRLSEYGKHLTFQVRGLSNKFRERWPAVETGKVENYLDARFFRRTFVLHYEHLGDEFYRDQDRYDLQRASWEWIPTFQRNAQRKFIAYSRYWLNNVTAANGDSLNQALEDEFWPVYNQRRAEVGEKLPDLQSEINAIPKAAP